MATPKVVNISPAEGETFDPVEPIVFGVRDAENLVVSGSVYGFATFSKYGYRADETEELPLDDPFAFEVFSDALPVPRPLLRADVEDDGDVLAISSSTTSPSANTLFLYAPVSYRVPTGAEIRFRVSSPAAPAAADYQSNTDYIGVHAGFVHWPSQTGVFIMFCDDAGTKYVEVSGVSDAAGLREVPTRYDIDWSDFSTFRIFFDASRYVGKAVVLITDETTKIETEIFSENISDLGTFISTARIGGRDVSSTSDGVTAFVGIDYERAASIEVSHILVESHGEVLVAAGGVAYRQTGVAQASGVIAAQLRSDVVMMRRSPLTWLTSIDQIVIEGAVTEDSRLRSEEPQLEAGNWLVFLRGRPQQQVHTGSYNTGMGFDVSDGTNICQFRFLNKDEPEFGIFTADISSNQLLSDNYTKSAFPWDSADSEILAVSFDGNVEAVITSDISSASLSSWPISLVYPTVLSDSAQNPRFDLGVLDQQKAIDEDTGVEFTGFLTIENFVFMPLYEYTSDITTWTSHGTHDFYYKTIPSEEFVPNASGITVLVRATIGDITDQFGQINPVRMPSAALIAIPVTSTTFVQLQFVTSEDGSETFVFVSQDAQDYKEVLNPTSEVGRLISAQVDPTTEHFYLLCYQPGLGLRLFIDFAETPSIFIPWEDVGVAAKADLDSVLSGISVAVGSIPTLKFGSDFNSMAVTVTLAAVSVGSGYDYRVQLGTSRSDLESKVYSADANVFLTFTDTDP